MGVIGGERILPLILASIRLLPVRANNPDAGLTDDGETPPELIKNLYSSLRLAGGSLFQAGKFSHRVLSGSVLVIRTLIVRTAGIVGIIRIRRLMRPPAWGFWVVSE